MPDCDYNLIQNDVECGAVPTRSRKIVPAWALLSVVANGFLLLTVLLLLRGYSLPWLAKASAAANQSQLPRSTVSATPELGPRHQLTYDQWLTLLQQEAKAAATDRPKRLNILVGDSLSLWFPPELLPTQQSWLNQGISGETSAGLLRRLELFDETQPETIFVLIGINDLIRGVGDADLLENQYRIIRDLQQVHPQAQIVLQSILPHAGDRATWQGKDRLNAISNDHIRQLNQELKAIAEEAGVHFLDLHPLFTDAQGNLRTDFTTDGLHLSTQGYLVWRSALQLFREMKLAPLTAQS
ncbi:MAG: lysophospholipase [Trichocoleus desertorum ATA4-8-CV12]|jgi:lysophospholipase L1-like esterase|nr:lysophospholipase [Trichocoleus desertorum ATA4-8-CV12]